jgi:hypothetical protein
MPEPTINQIFGAAAVQTGTTLTITKADLAAVGLTASATNTAESLFVALLLLAKASLTPTASETNADQSVIVAEQDFDFQSLVTRNNQTFRQTAYTVKLQKVDTASVINPNDY